MVDGDAGDRGESVLRNTGVELKLPPENVILQHQAVMACSVLVIKANRQNAAKVEEE